MVAEYIFIVDSQGQNAFIGQHPHGLTVFTAVVFAVGEMAGSGVLALPAALSGTGTNIPLFPFH